MRRADRLFQIIQILRRQRGAHHGRRARRGARDLEAHRLPRHRRPDGPARPHPRRGGHGLRPRSRLRHAAADAHARRDRGRRPGRAVGRATAATTPCAGRRRISSPRSPPPSPSACAPSCSSRRRRASRVWQQAPDALDMVAVRDGDPRRHEDRASLPRRGGARERARRSWPVVVGYLRVDAPPRGVVRATRGLPVLPHRPRACTPTFLKEPYGERPSALRARWRKTLPPDRRAAEGGLDPCRDRASSVGAAEGAGAEHHVHLVRAGEGEAARCPPAAVPSRHRAEAVAARRRTVQLSPQLGERRRLHAPRAPPAPPRSCCTSPVLASARASTSPAW